MCLCVCVHMCVSFAPLFALHKFCILCMVKYLQHGNMHSLQNAFFSTYKHFKPNTSLSWHILQCARVPNPYFYINKHKCTSVKGTNYLGSTAGSFGSQSKKLVRQLRSKSSALLATPSDICFGWAPSNNFPINVHRDKIKYK